MPTAPEAMTLKVIAHIHTAFPTKFGIPRQSGLVDSLRGEIIFTPEYRNADAVRGLEDFSHIWLVWQFSGAVRDTWSPTVRPPRLGGNTRMGVFATRSPFRPNPIGLSCVELTGVAWDTPDGPVIHVRGADLVDGTPILDIKPYLPYCDARPDARGGFTDALNSEALAGGVGAGGGKYPDYPVALGVIRAVEDDAVYDRAVERQVEEVKAASKIHSVDDLLRSGATWEVE